MASFYENTKGNVKENLRDTFEDRTGILGETLRKRREARDRQQEIEQEVTQINQATAVVRKTGGTLSSLELSFTQISENIQSIAKSLNAQVITFDETRLVMREAQREQVTQQKAPPKLIESINKDKDDDTSMFNKLDSLLDLLKKSPKGKGGGKGGRGKGRVGRLTRLSKFAKMGGRILGPVGLLLGAYEASQYLKEVNYGDRMAKGQGQLAEQAYKNKKTDFSQMELTQQQAMDILSQPDSPGKARDIASFGGIERLQQIAGIKTRSMGFQGKQMGTAPSQPEEGRATVRDERWLEHEVQEESAADKIRAKLTPSQLEWLGGADPTDESIMARMPAPLPSEVAVQVTMPPPVVKPPAPPRVAAPVDESEAEARRLARMGKRPTPTAKPLPIPDSGDKWIMDMIKKHEGVRTRPYKDSLGLWTVGVGHLIGDGKSLPPEWNRELTMQEVDQLFAKDYASHKEAATKIPGYQKVNDYGKGALIDLTFNMGNAWYKKWPNFVKSLSSGDYMAAAASLVDSKWFQQVKSRATTIVELIKRAGTGMDVNSASVNVAAAKKDLQTSGNVVVVNNTTNQIKGATVTPPRTTEVTSRVGA